MSVNRSYADAGVNSAVIRVFKEKMKDVARATKSFSLQHGVKVLDLANSHGGVWEYVGDKPHCFCTTVEGLGNKNWLAEWMYMHVPELGSHYDKIAICNALMAWNDCAAHGAIPFAYMDEVAAGSSEWFADDVRSGDFSRGMLGLCRDHSVTLLGGESPSMKYLVKAMLPVADAPVLSGAVTGIIAPSSKLIAGERLASGNFIVGIGSRGMHANGCSLAFKRGLDLKDKFLTKLPSGVTLGESILRPTMSYVGLVKAFAEQGIDVTAYLPGTGDGVRKMAGSEQELSYYINHWPKDLDELFLFLLECGIPIEDFLGTFNCGIGYYAFVSSRNDAERSVIVAENAGYDAWVLGRTAAGERKVYFRPESGFPKVPKEGIVLLPAE